MKNEKPVPLEELGKKAAELGELLILPGRHISGRNKMTGRVVTLYEKDDPSKRYRIKLLREVTREEFEAQRRRMGLTTHTRGEFFHEVISD